MEEKKHETEYSEEKWNSWTSCVASGYFRNTIIGMNAIKLQEERTWGMIKNCYEEFHEQKEMTLKR